MENCIQVSVTYNKEKKKYVIYFSKNGFGLDDSFETKLFFIDPEAIKQSERDRYNEESQDAFGDEYDSDEDDWYD